MNPPPGLPLPSGPTPDPLPDGIIPLEPAPTPPPRSPKIVAPALTHTDLTACPNCHAPLAPDAVLCTACGLDLRIGAKREVEVGEVEAPQPHADAKPEFVKPTRLSPSAHLAFAGAAALGAMITAGVNASSSAGDRATTLLIILVVLLTLYQTLVHTGTGVVAVAIAAKLAKSKLERYDLAAGRMFLALATFQFISHLRIPGAPTTLSVVLAYPAASAAYFFSVMALFKLRRDQASVLCGSHLILWALFESGIMLSGWLGAELASLPPPPPAP